AGSPKTVSLHREDREVASDPADLDRRTLSHHLRRSAVPPGPTARSAQASRPSSSAGFRLVAGRSGFRRRHDGFDSSPWGRHWSSCHRGRSRRARASLSVAMTPGLYSVPKASRPTRLDRTGVGPTGGSRSVPTLADMTDLLW